MSMEKKPFLSIIMPVYNAENTIAYTIESIQEQTYDNWELIVVDDYSKDNTTRIIKEYVEKDKRIHLYFQKENAGPGKAKNTGLRFANGKYVTFCDADDWIEKNTYQCMALEGTVLEDVVVAGYYRDVYDSSAKVIERNSVNMRAFSCENNAKIIAAISELDERRLFSFAWNKLYKKEVIDKYKIEFSDKKFGEDFDFNINFFKYAESLKVLKDGFYHYVKKNAESLTERYVPDFFEINKDRFKKMRELIESKDMYNGYICECIMNAYIKHAVAAIARLNDKRSGNSWKDYREQVKKIMKDEMSVEAIKFSKARSGKEKICNGVFKTKSIIINMIFGKILWMMQTKGKKMFERIK